MAKFFGKNRRSGNNRPGQCAAASFVNSRNARDSRDAEFFFVAKSAAAVGHRQKLSADSADYHRFFLGWPSFADQPKSAKSVEEVIRYSRTAVASFPLRVRR